MEMRRRPGDDDGVTRRKGIHLKEIDVMKIESWQMSRFNAGWHCMDENEKRRWK